MSSFRVTCSVLYPGESECESVGESGMESDEEGSESEEEEELPNGDMGELL